MESDDVKSLCTSIRRVVVNEQLDLPEIVLEKIDAFAAVRGRIWTILVLIWLTVLYLVNHRLAETFDSLAIASAFLLWCSLMCIVFTFVRDERTITNLALLITQIRLLLEIGKASSKNNLGQQEILMFVVSVLIYFMSMLMLIIISPRYALLKSLAQLLVMWTLIANKLHLQADLKLIGIALGSAFMILLFQVLVTLILKN